MKDEDLSDFDPYANPDLQNGPLSEPDDAAVEADYRKAMASWLEMPVLERMALEAKLRAQGVDTDSLHTQPL